MSKRRRHRNSHWDKPDMDVLEATSETFRIQTDQAFQQFISDEELREFSFPHDLNNFERKHIHQKAIQYNLMSRSHGKEPHRILTVYKKGAQSNFESFYIDLCPKSRQKLCDIQPVTLRPEQSEHAAQSNRARQNLTLGGPCEVQESRASSQMQLFRQTLPIFERKAVVMEAIRGNSVVIISSETGSGKTTQIPQYIMEDCRSRGEDCKIVCTQPRRISTVSAAERVSQERGSKLGDDVGYHIRLESKFSSNTNLVYCTSGVLIRSLMSGNEVTKSFTHVIVDEVHERDKLSDFLLICLREILRQGIPLKVILMSATMNVDKFQNYFERAAIVTIPGRLYRIQQLFLDDVLELTEYQTVIAEKKRFLNRERLMNNAMYDQILDGIGANEVEAWDALFQAVFDDKFDVNYQHSKSGMTALMVAVQQNNICMVEKLCGLDCNPKIRCRSGHTAITLAESLDFQEIVLVLNLATHSISTRHVLLNDYYKTSSDEDIDYELLVRLVCHLHTHYQEGAILVFLPGYDDIMLCKDLLADTDLDPLSYTVFMLHGSMDIREQHEVFKQSPGVRKIILATNIAETSLTIEDVVYVVDAGKAKEQNYDSSTGQSSLQTRWISKACVKQRAGRAGRTQSGVAFHLFSRNRYESLLDERKPEILRVPLEELCLNTKWLTGTNVSIYNFLSQAPDAPSLTTVKTAIENLVCLGALDENENLTPLGKWLSQLTIEPHLGKILIYAVFFQCLDPVLTMVASMAQKDPFQLPAQANLRTAAADQRKHLMLDTCSDHLVHVIAFIRWQNAVKSRSERQFCRDYYINRSTMDTIQKTRSQLLAQLRAINVLIGNGPAMVTLNAHAHNWPLVKAVIATGLYPRVAFNRGAAYATRSEKKVHVHNSNPMSKEPVPVWLMYDEMVKVRNGNHLRGVTPVTPLTISLFCGKKATILSENTLALDDWLEFEYATPPLIKLRSLIDAFVARKLRTPLSHLSGDEQRTLACVADILALEDAVAGLTAPHGIDKRPRFTEFRRHFEFTAERQMHNESRNATRNNNGGTRNHNGTMALHRNGSGSGTTASLSSSSSQSSISAALFATEGATAAVPVDRLKCACFLLINSKTEGSVELAQQNNCWVFSPQTEKKIIQLHDQQTSTIYLFYAVPTLSTFCGVAQFQRMDLNGRKPRARLQWIAKKWFPFNRTSHLRNRLDDNRLVWKGSDGQQIDIDTALNLWDIFCTD